MPIAFQTAADLAEWLPDAPKYVEGDQAWVSLATARAMLDLSPTGFDNARQRMGRRYEQKDKSGRVWLFGPLWFRVYFAVRSEQQQLKGGVRV